MIKSTEDIIKETNICLLLEERLEQLAVIIDRLQRDMFELQRSEEEHTRIKSILVVLDPDRQKQVKDRSER